MDVSRPQPSRPKRSLAKWMLLLLIWVVGLAVWTIYALAMGYLLMKLLL